VSTPIGSPVVEPVLTTYAEFGEQFFARAARPLLIVIDVEPPTRANVDVKVQADGLRASVLQIVGRVDAEVRRAVAKYVARELRKPQIQQARMIDVAAALAAYSHHT
jgi:hypothetical protein